LNKGLKAPFCRQKSGFKVLNTRAALQTFFRKGSTGGGFEITLEIKGLENA
jgi:hypothetical protein